MKLSKTMVTGLAIVGILSLGMFMVHKYKKGACGCSSNNGASATKATIPTTYSVFTDDLKQAGNKFWTDGLNFFRQPFGPLVKSTPQNITEEQYVNSYSG